MKNTSIFILDLDSTRCNFLRYHMLGNGFKNVRGFSSLTECMYIIEKNNHPDFIILDPAQKSETFLEFMRLVSQINPYIRYIVYSTNSDETVMNRFLKAGAKDYIHRNESNVRNLSELISNIRFLLKGAE